MLAMLRKGVLVGSSAGVLLAGILISLDLSHPFSGPTQSVIERFAFRLCPLYILMFANGMGTMTKVVMVTIIGNALIYGVLGGLIAVGRSLLTRERSFTRTI